MRYVGGKFRQRAAIKQMLELIYAGEKTYYEPFAGAMGVAEYAIPALAKRGVKHFILNDSNKHLIRLWRAMRDGRYRPPEFIGKERYYAESEMARHSDYPTLDQIYMGFAISFAGKWFAGYAHDKRISDRKMEEGARNGTIKKANILTDYDVTLYCNSYETALPVTNKPPTLIYLDPPYKGKNYYPHQKTFDTDMFWKIAEEWSGIHNVIATEFEAPPPWEQVYNFGNTIRNHVSGSSMATVREASEAIWRITKGYN